MARSRMGIGLQIDNLTFVQFDAGDHGFFYRLSSIAHRHLIQSHSLKVYSMLLILIAGMVGGCAPDSKLQHKAEEQDQRAILNEGYSILYSHISNLSLLHLIFLVKAESEEVNEMTREVTDYAGALKKTLESVAKNYPAVNIELDPIPAIEKRTRNAVTKDRLMNFAPVFGLTGESFDRRVLQSLEGVLNQLRFMCKVLAEEEPEPSLKQIWTNAHTQFERLYARVLGLLQEKYYINTGERKVKK